MVDFGGWDMPVHTGRYHRRAPRTRRHAGLFDVSHMGGSCARADAITIINYLVSNDAAKQSTARLSILR